MEKEIKEEIEEEETREFSPLENALCELLVGNDIDDILCDTALVAFSTDESLEKAIAWLKEHPDFENRHVSRIIGEFGVESEDFTTHIEIVDDEEE